LAKHPETKWTVVDYRDLVSHPKATMEAVYDALDAAKEQPQMAQVVEVGPGGVVDGKEIVMELKVGDRVIFQKYAGNEVKIEGQEYTILKQSDILAVVE